MAKKKKSAGEFPNTIHVVREEDGDSSWLNAYEDGVDKVEESGVPVAIYRLESIGIVKIEKTIQGVK